MRTVTSMVTTGKRAAGHLGRVCLLVVDIQALNVNEQGVLVCQLACRHIGVVPALRLILCIRLLERLQLLPHHITSLHKCVSITTQYHCRVSLDEVIDHDLDLMQQMLPKQLEVKDLLEEQMACCDVAQKLALA